MIPGLSLRGGRWYQAWPTHPQESFKGRCSGLAPQSIGVVKHVGGNRPLQGAAEGAVPGGASGPTSTSTQTRKGEPLMQALTQILALSCPALSPTPFTFDEASPSAPPPQSRPSTWRSAPRSPAPQQGRVSAPNLPLAPPRPASLLLGQARLTLFSASCRLSSCSASVCSRSLSCRAWSCSFSSLWKEKAPVYSACQFL